MTEFYDQTAAVLFSTAARILGDTHEAEEVVQDVFVQIWNKAATFDGALGAPFHWALGSPAAELPLSLRDKVLHRIDEVGRVAPRAPQTSETGAQRTARPTMLTTLAGLHFEIGASEKGWKALPVPGAYIKLQERGYAVLMGKLDPGTRYPAHVNAGPEDFFILTGDLVIGDRKMVAGDFHHADRGSQHAENYSVEGCTLLAVLTTDDPLVAFAMA